MNGYSPNRRAKKLIDFVVRKQKYQQGFEIFGTRNSYSKTDHDATFMRMKEDYMKNGQLKAGYKLQVAIEGQYAIAYSLFPNLTDTRILISFLEVIEQDYFELPQHIVADSAYGREQNYDDILPNRKRVALITHGMYIKEQKKKYKQNKFNSATWQYDEENDMYTCPNQQRLLFKYHSVRTDKAGFTREFKVYGCEDCSGCLFRSSCTKAKEGNHRKLMVNEKWKQQKEYVRTKLSDQKNGIYLSSAKNRYRTSFWILGGEIAFHSIFRSREIEG